MINVRSVHFLNITVLFPFNQKWWEETFSIWFGPFSPILNPPQFATLHMRAATYRSSFALPTSPFSCVRERRFVDFTHKGFAVHPFVPICLCFFSAEVYCTLLVEAIKLSQGDEENISLHESFAACEPCAPRADKRGKGIIPYHSIKNKILCSCRWSTRRKGPITSIDFLKKTTECQDGIRINNFPIGSNELYQTTTSS